ncbi:MAG TPA: heavy metal-associated domain-containing protein, partial [Candidatus Nanopelagicales bacterium]|nr:heavy metal-associated domain-containing protein [Candidatus Nanopelagicales bacterium]
MTTPTQTFTEVDLDIGGMTCASCAARVEKKLNRMPGVTATVNYATERAHVALPAGLTISDAIATVEATGYSASEPAQEDGEQEAREDDEVAELRSRVIISAIL